MLVQRDPLLLVAASSGGEPAAALRRRLDLLHSQITLIVSNAIDKLFARNPRYDGRSLLGAPLSSCGPETLHVQTRPISLPDCIKLYSCMTAAERPSARAARKCKCFLEASQLAHLRYTLHSWNSLFEHLYAAVVGARAGAAGARRRGSGPSYHLSFDHLSLQFLLHAVGTGPVLRALADEVEVTPWGLLPAFPPAPLAASLRSTAVHALQATIKVR